MWPRANAQTENFMKPLNKGIQAAKTEGKSWRQQLFKFLRNYRATPHATTGEPPAKLLYGANIRTLLPEAVEEKDDARLRERDEKEKRKQKMYADMRHSCLMSMSEIR